MNMQVLLLAVAMAAATSVAMADETTFETNSAVGVEVWFADNGRAVEPLWGLNVCAEIIPRVWLAGEYLAGKYESVGDTEKIASGDVLGGYSLKYIDAGIGFRYLAINVDLSDGWDWWGVDDIGYDEGKQRNADIYGPMVYLGTKYDSVESPFGLYGKAFWMFKDFGGNTSMGFDGSHYTLEFGFSAQWKRLSGMLGYRYQKYADLPPRDVKGKKFGQNIVDGFVASLRLML